MPELIDRQAALEVAMRYCPDDDGSCSKAGHDIREMLDEIEALPTIEAEPVRLGRWIKQENGLNLCSVCGVTKVSHLPFCGHCGADMREVREDATN